MGLFVPLDAASYCAVGDHAIPSRDRSAALYAQGGTDYLPKLVHKGRPRHVEAALFRTRGLGFERGVERVPRQ